MPETATVGSRKITTGYLRNVIWTGAATITSMASSLFYGLLVARYLGPGDFGRFALVVGVGGWLIALAQGSGTTALTILAAKQRQATQLFWPGIVIQLGVGILAIAVSLPVVWILSQDVGLLLPSATYGLANLAFLAIAVPVSIYRGLDRMEWGVALSATGLLLVGLMIVVQRWNLGFEMVIGVNALSQFLVLAIVAPLAYKGLAVHGWDQETFTQLWKASIPLWGVTIFQSLHWRVGILMVQAFAGTYQLGLYSAASKLIENLRLIPWFLLIAALPAFVRASHSDKAELSVILQKALHYILIVAFPLGMGLVVLAPWIISVLYTPAFATSAQFLRLGSLGLVPLLVHWALLNVLISVNRERALIVMYVLSIIVEGILDIFIVPLWGAGGASLGYVAGETGLALLSIIYVYKRIVPIGWNGLWQIASIGAVVLALGFLQPSEVNPFLWALILCLLYFGVLFGMRILTWAELRSLVQRPVQI